MTRLPYIAAVLGILAPVCFLLGIWTEQIKWYGTGTVLLVSSLPLWMAFAFWEVESSTPPPQRKRGKP